ncbi:hypothetical protein GGR58DRAFT_225108 [Xylaria digitata]|nr:hypothetical protein GGR58DRAFT_225108 [Xylaria digitata]
MQEKDLLVGSIVQNVSRTALSWPTVKDHKRSFSELSDSDSDSELDSDSTLDHYSLIYPTMADPESSKRHKKHRIKPPSNLPTQDQLAGGLPRQIRFSSIPEASSSTLRSSEENKLQSSQQESSNPNTPRIEEDAEDSDEGLFVPNTPQPQPRNTPIPPPIFPTSTTMSRRGNGEPERLDINDYDIKIQASKLVKSGAGFSIVPKLRDGGANWNDFNTALHDAALGEGVKDILNGKFPRPTPPDGDVDAQTWNNFVKRSIYWETMNNHLLAGIRGKLDTTIRQEQDINDETDAYTVYRQLTTYCQQRGANHLLDLSYALAKKTLPQMKGIDEYNKHWVDNCQALDSLQLSWKIPDQLKQLWYMANLGDAFDNWKTSMTTSYAIADVGTGTLILLKELMSKARDHWVKLSGSAKRNASTMAAYYLEDAHTDNEVYFTKRQKTDHNQSYQ